MINSHPEQPRHCQQKRSALFILVIGWSRSIVATWYSRQTIDISIISSWMKIVTASWSSWLIAFQGAAPSLPWSGAGDATQWLIEISLCAPCGCCSYSEIAFTDMNTVLQINLLPKRDVVYCRFHGLLIVFLSVCLFIMSSVVHHERRGTKAWFIFETNGRLIALLRESMSRCEKRLFALRKW